PTVSADIGGITPEAKIETTPKVTTPFQPPEELEVGELAKIGEETIAEKKKVLRGLNFGPLSNFK
ncbi:hypothetical protein LCGC14_1339460, partial [marine sediment metagenome]